MEQLRIQTRTGIKTNHESVIRRLLTKVGKMAKNRPKYQISQAKNSQKLQT